jgi:hypothetical protein
MQPPHATGGCISSVLPGIARGVRVSGLCDRVPAGVSRSPTPQQRDRSRCWRPAASGARRGLETPAARGARRGLETPAARLSARGPESTMERFCGTWPLGECSACSARICKHLVRAGSGNGERSQSVPGLASIGCSQVLARRLRSVACRRRAPASLSSRHNHRSLDS